MKGQLWIIHSRAIRLFLLNKTSLQCACKHLCEHHRILSFPLTKNTKQPTVSSWCVFLGHSYMNAAINVFSSKRAAAELTGTLDQFIPDSTVSLSSQKHNLCGGLGRLAVLSWSSSTSIPLFSLSLSLSRPRTHVEEIERFEKQSGPPFRWLTPTDTSNTIALKRSELVI